MKNYIFCTVIALVSLVGCNEGVKQSNGDDGVENTTEQVLENNVYSEVKYFAEELNQFYPRTISPFMTAKSAQFSEESAELIYEYTLKRDDLIMQNYGSLENFKVDLHTKFSAMAKMDPYQSYFLHNDIVIRYNFTWENGGFFESVVLTEESVFN